MQPGGRQPQSRLDRHDLGQVAAVASGCTLCRLCHTRTHVLFGEGDEAADLMFVGEGPGYHEDRVGTSLVGAAGDLFDELLRSINLTREQVYVTSVIKCRTPRNRTPFPDEVEQCEGYLFRQISIVQPRVVCAFGSVAIRLLTGKRHRLSQVHGRPFSTTMNGRNVTVLPLFHPAAAIQVPALGAALRADVRQLPRLMQDGLEHAPAPSATAMPSGTGERVPAIATRAPVETPRPEPADRPQLALDLG